MKNSIFAWMKLNKFAYLYSNNLEITLIILKKHLEFYNLKKTRKTMEFFSPEKWESCKYLGDIHKTCIFGKIITFKAFGVLG